MMMLRTTLIYLCSGLIAIQASDAVNRTIFGVDAALSAGAYALRRGDYEEGLSLTLEGLHSAVERRNKANAYNNLCAGYVGTEQFNKALEACNQALKFNDRNWHAYNNRALALLGVGLVVAARGDLEKGIALNPESSTLARVAQLVDERERSQLVASDAEFDSD